MHIVEETAFSRYPNACGPNRATVACNPSGTRLSHRRGGSVSVGDNRRAPSPWGHLHEPFSAKCRGGVAPARGGPRRDFADAGNKPTARKQET